MREDFGTHSSRVPLAGDSPLYSRISSDVLCDQMAKLRAVKCIVSSFSEYKETGALLRHVHPKVSLGPVLKPDTRTVRISNGAKIATASFHQRDFDLRSRFANQKPVRFARIDIDRPRLDPFRTDLSLNFFPTRKWSVDGSMEKPWRLQSYSAAVIERLECCGQAREWRGYGESGCHNNPRRYKYWKLNPNLPTL